MTSFTYEGNLEGLNQTHLDYISKVLSERGFKPAIVRVEQVGKLGDNYQASVKRFIIEDFAMIAKIALTVQILRDKMQTARSFRNESAIYTNVLPKFSELLKEVGIEDRLQMAECYGYFAEEPNEVLLLEDLSMTGHAILNKLEPLPVAAVDKALKDFAALHGLSYVLKSRDRELFNSLSRGLKHVWGEVDESFEATMSAVEPDMLNLLDCEDYKERGRGLIVKQPAETLRMEAQDKEETDCTVILQGDAWTNNLMFKYEDGNLDSLIMIDYQLSRESNPVLDLTYMIFNCTDYEMRAKHFHRWLDLYHEELTRITSLFGVDVNQFFTREDLDRNLKRYAKSALGVALMFNVFVLKESEEVFDFKKEFAERTEMKMDDFLEFAKTTNLNERSSLRLKDRINGLFRTFEDLGFFKDDVWK